MAGWPAGRQLQGAATLKLCSETGRSSWTSCSCSASGYPTGPDRRRTAGRGRRWRRRYMCTLVNRTFKLRTSWLCLAGEELVVGGAVEPIQLGGGHHRALGLCSPAVNKLCGYLDE